MKRLIPLIPLFCVLMAGCASHHVVLPAHLAEPCECPDMVIADGADVLIMLAGYRQALNECADRHRQIVELIEAKK